jgi:hypothetical protein
MIDDDVILYRFALDCAEHKAVNNCNRQCRTCASNISLYTDKRTAVLLQHSAELEVQDRVNSRASQLRRQTDANNAKQQSEHKVGILFGIMPLVSFIIIMALIIAAYSKPKEVTVAPPSPPVQQSVVAVEPTVVKTDYLEDIRVTLRKIYDADMSGDGKVTCVDHAIQFWNYYPRQNEVRVIWNNNKVKNWNHLFVSVNGMMIEPAAYIKYTTPERWFTIQRIWPNEYDASLNVDVTQHMDKIKIGRYWVN